MTAWVMDEDDEVDVLRYDLEMAERRLQDMETALHRIVNEPEWNQALRRQRRKVQDLRGELEEMEA